MEVLITSVAALPLPRSIYIEPTSRCNELCQQCPRTLLSREEDRDLSFDEFRRVVDQFPVLERVVLHGLGEPLLNKDLPRMISYLKARGVYVLFNSNGILLNAKRGQALIDAGLDEYRLSMDGATREMYARVRGVDAFDKVWRNVGAFIAMQKKQSAGKPAVSLWFTAMKENLLLAAGSAAKEAGFAASLMAAALMGVLKLEAGIPTPVELFGDHVLKLLPAGRFVQFLITFGRNAKTEPLGLTLLGMIGLGTLLGLLYAPLVRVALPASGYRPARREWLVAAVLAMVMTLAAVALFWGELGQNFLGLPIAWAMLVTALAMLAEFSVYGATLCIAYRALLPKQPAPGVSAQVQERRQLLARAGIAALSLGGGAGTLGLMRGFLTGDSFTSYDGTETSAHKGFTAPITPNNEHYVVTQNPVDPTPNLDVWRLEVTGLVGSPGTYTYEQLQNMPSTSRAITLECISNGPGGRLISTAIWQGVTVRTLLARHGGALPNAHYVAFYSVDGYTVSLPLEEVLKVDALLAWQMNGVTLPNRHGFPLRVLVPGRYGEENPKWLTRVELTDRFVGGLYADQGWYNGPVHTWNRIDRPRGHVPLGSPVEVGGIAFAGARGVQKVEVSVDDGLTWHQAQLEPPLSQDAWVLWSWQWLPTLPGRYTLESRVTDGTGEVQTSHMQGTVPNGATGYHIVVVNVA